MKFVSGGKGYMYVCPKNASFSHDQSKKYHGLDIKNSKLS